MQYVFQLSARTASGEGRPLGIFDRSAVVAAGDRHVPSAIASKTTFSHIMPWAIIPRAAMEIHAPRYRPPVTTDDGPKGLLRIASRHGARPLLGTT
eukprot:852807-Lingulodinium_polyedra.AAC.1